MNATMQQTSRKSPRAYLGAILIAVGISVAAGSAPASAQTIWDTSFPNKISGITPQVRTELQAIAKSSRTQLMATLAKYGIDPASETPDSDMLMKASKDLQAVGRAERQAVLPLLKPEEMAQYDTMIAATTQRIRDAMK